MEQYESVCYDYSMHDLNTWKDSLCLWSLVLLLLENMLGLKLRSFRKAQDEKEYSRVRTLLVQSTSHGTTRVTEQILDKRRKLR